MSTQPGNPRPLARPPNLSPAADPDALLWWVVGLLIIVVIVAAILAI
ncbi:hypothetical protein [Mycobacterium paraense]|nr:hypothetical protein [Mycobacterium paraense]MCV7443357.1 hypothetical protein [Mycobacterium paraense]